MKVRLTDGRVQEFHFDDFSWGMFGRTPKRLLRLLDEYGLSQAKPFIEESKFRLNPKTKRDYSFLRSGILISKTCRQVSTAIG
jgi:hypothetical protein